MGPSDHHHLHPSQQQQQENGYLSNTRVPTDPIVEQGFRELLTQKPNLSQYLDVATDSIVPNPQPPVGTSPSSYHQNIRPASNNGRGTEQPTDVLLQSLAPTDVDATEAGATRTTAGLLQRGGGGGGGGGGLESVDGLQLDMAAVVGAQELSSHHHTHHDGLSRTGGTGTSQLAQLPFLVKNEVIDQELPGSTSSQQLPPLSGSPGSSQSSGVASIRGMTSHEMLQHSALGHQSALHHTASLPSAAHHATAFHHSTAHLMNPAAHLQHLPHHMLHAHELAAAAAAAAAVVGTDPRHLHHYGGGLPAGVGPPDCLTTQKAVAFLGGPRERIHVLGNPVEHCPRCQQEGLGTTGWRPHRHIGELKIRYICERHFDDLESNHHFDIPLCPICNQVLYLYDFNNMLGVSNARRLHKYVLKCANRHVLPLLDLFCQTKKGGERCNANFKLQWCYGTMVKRCEAQKNRDHDLWWVRYKNEWKQRRTIIRYKKDFLSHLTDAQRSLLLGLGLEGEPPPDPKTALGPTFDALVSSAGGSPSGPKMKKRTAERSGIGSMTDGYGGDMAHPAKRRYRPSQHQSEYGRTGGNTNGSGGNRSTNNGGYNQQSSMGGGRSDPSTTGNVTVPTTQQGGNDARLPKNGLAELDPSLRHLMGAVVIPTRQPDETNSTIMGYLQQPQRQSAPSSSSSPVLQGGSSSYSTSQQFSDAALFNIPPHMIVTGTPTPPLQNANGTSPVAVTCEGVVLHHTL